MMIRALLSLGCSFLLLACSSDPGESDTEAAEAGDASNRTPEAGAEAGGGIEADGDGGGSSCIDLTPASCPADDPSYAADVVPLMQAKCLPCHSPGGVESTVPFTSYTRVFGRRMTIQQFVRDCVMPPSNADGGTLDPEERKLLLTWLQCGAPNN